MPYFRAPRRSLGRHNNLGRLGVIAPHAAINGGTYVIGGMAAAHLAQPATGIVPALITPVQVAPPPISAPVVSPPPPATVSPVIPKPVAVPVSPPKTLPIVTPPVITPTVITPSGGVINVSTIPVAAIAQVAKLPIISSYVHQAASYAASAVGLTSSGGSYLSSIGNYINPGGYITSYGGAIAGILNSVIGKAPASSAAGQLSSQIGTAASVMTAINTILNTVGYSNPVTAVIAVVADIAEALANVIGNTHPAGHDTFVAIQPNGGPAMNDDESLNQTDSRTLAWNAAIVDAINRVFQLLQSHGFTLTNPAIIIEIRDDGSTPAELHTNVVPMTAAEQAQYNLPNGWKGAPGWNDRDPSQYVSLGPPGNLQGVMTAFLNWLINNSYIHAPPVIRPQVAAPAPKPPPVAPTVPTPVPVVVAPSPVVPKPIAPPPAVVTPTQITPPKPVPPVRNINPGAKMIGQYSILGGSYASVGGGTSASYNPLATSGGYYGGTALPTRYVGGSGYSYGNAYAALFGSYGGGYYGGTSIPAVQTPTQVGAGSSVYGAIGAAAQAAAAAYAAHAATQRQQQQQAYAQQRQQAAYAYAQRRAAYARAAYQRRVARVQAARRARALAIQRQRAIARRRASFRYRRRVYG